MKLFVAVRETITMSLKPEEMSVDKMLEELSSKANEFSSLSDQDMLDLCEELLANLYNRTDEWSNAGNWTIENVKVEGLHPKDDAGKEFSSIAQKTASGSRFIVGESVAGVLKCNQERLRALVEGKTPSPWKNEARTLEVDGEEITIYGRKGLPVPGHEFELWTSKKNTSPKEVKAGSVAVVLGAGNQPFLATGDVLECIFVKRKPVLLKHHPLRPHLIHPYEIIFVSSIVSTLG